MNRINEFNIEPGPYMDEAGTTLVVVDVVNHVYNSVAQLPDHISDALVILRPLDISKSEHIRYAYPVSVFTHKFVKL